MTTTMLDAALFLAKGGVPVFPCSPGEKRPMTPAGFKDATTAEATIRAWWGSTPAANLAMPTGALSGMVVIDLDMDAAKGIDGEAAWKEIVGDKSLPATCEVRTPRGGRHLYFRHPGGDACVRSSASKLAKGVDVRGDGGYIMLPPSATAAGRYVACKEAPPAAMPSWLRELLMEPKAPVAKPATAKAHAPEESLALARECLRQTDPAALSYADWVTVGMALKHAGAEVGEWVEWSRKDAGRFHEGECEAKWTSFNGSGTPVGPGTLVKLCREHGGTVKTDSPAPAGTKPVIVLPSIRQLEDGRTVAVTVPDSAASLFSALAKTEKFFAYCRAPATLAEGEEGAVTLRQLEEVKLIANVQHHTELRAWKADKEAGYTLAPVHTLGTSTAAALLATNEATSLLPKVSLICQAPPLFEADGQLRAMRPGYNPHNGGIYVAGGREIPEVPLTDAVQALGELLTDFDFVTPGDRARALAALISPALKFAGVLGGHLPATMVEADKSQSGKNFLLFLIAAVYGEAFKVATMKDEGESGGVGSVRESVANLLVSGKPFVALSNIRGKVACQALEEGLTADGELEVRLPYARPMSVNPRRSAWAFTSNEAKLNEDMSNRCSIVRIRKRPDGYSFKAWPCEGGSIKDYVRADWPFLLGCVYAVVKAWHAAGKPRVKDCDHDFREWAGAMEWISRNLLEAGPLLDGHREVQRLISNPALVFLRQLALAAVRHKQPELGWRTAQLVTVAETAGAGLSIPGVRLSMDEASTVKALGKVLASAFRDGNTVTVDDVNVTRITVYDSTKGRNERFYQFRKHEGKAAAGPAAAPATVPHEAPTEPRESPRSLPPAKPVEPGLAAARAAWRAKIEAMYPRPKTAGNATPVQGSVVGTVP